MTWCCGFDSIRTSKMNFANNRLPNLRIFRKYMLMEILLKKVRRRKCDPLCPVDNLHNCLCIEQTMTYRFSLFYKVKFVLCPAFHNRTNYYLHIFGRTNYYLYFFCRTNSNLPVEQTITSVEQTVTTICRTNLT